MTPRPPLYTRICALDDCAIEFQTDNPRKKHCTSAHSVTHRMRNKRARDRKNRGGGGDGGGNGGGGGNPTLFDTLTPQDSRAIYVPDTCYRTPEVVPKRKPVPASDDTTPVAA